MTQYSLSTSQLSPLQRNINQHIKTQTEIKHGVLHWAGMLHRARAKWIQEEAQDYCLILLCCGVDRVSPCCLRKLDDIPKYLYVMWQIFASDHRMVTNDAMGQIRHSRACLPCFPPRHQLSVVPRSCQEVLHRAPGLVCDAHHRSDCTSCSHCLLHHCSLHYRQSSDTGKLVLRWDPRM